MPRATLWPLPALPLVFLALLTPVAAAGEPEAVGWLRGYLQIDTTNPPGNERPAAEYLAAILAKEGIDAQLFESPGGRTSLVARLRAAGSGGRGVALVHHLDVVPAEGTWTQPPFSGRLLDGRIWGRGAIDSKSLGIGFLAAMVALKRDGAALSRDLVYVAVADEERGGGQGAGWLLEAHPEFFEGVEGVLNEGGSNRVFRGRVLFWGVEVAQKRPLWLRVTASGRGGHASTLNPDSATHQLVRALARLLDRPLHWRVTAPVRTFFEALSEVDGSGDDAFGRRLDEIIRPEGPTSALPAGVPSYFLDTAQVTSIDTGKVSNAVSPEASATLDCRLLPDTDVDAFLAEIRAALGPAIDVETTVTAPEVAPSPVDHPLYAALAKTLSVRAPVIPTFIAGTTDSRWFRQRGIAAYGFQPFTIEPEDLRGIHAADETITVEDFLRGVELIRRVLLAYAGSP